jgi:hypothetical protein
MARLPFRSAVLSLPLTVACAPWGSFTEGEPGVGGPEVESHPIETDEAARRLDEHLGHTTARAASAVDLLARAPGLPRLLALADGPFAMSDLDGAALRGASEHLRTVLVDRVLVEARRVPAFEPDDEGLHFSLQASDVCEDDARCVELVTALSPRLVANGQVYGDSVDLALHVGDRPEALAVATLSPRDLVVDVDLSAVWAARTLLDAADELRTEAEESLSSLAGGVTVRFEHATSIPSLSAQVEGLAVVRPTDSGLDGIYVRQAGASVALEGTTLMPFAVSMLDLQLEDATGERFGLDGPAFVTWGMPTASGHLDLGAGTITVAAGEPGRGIEAVVRQDFVEVHRRGVAPLFPEETLGAHIEVQDETASRVRYFSTVDLKASSGTYAAPGQPTDTPPVFEDVTLTGAAKPTVVLDREARLTVVEQGRLVFDDWVKEPWSVEPGECGVFATGSVFDALADVQGCIVE